MLAVFVGLLTMQSWQVLAQDAAARWEALAFQAARERALNQAVPVAQEALAFARRSFGEKDPRTLISLGNLAVLLRDQGRYAEAEPLLREALQASRETLGPRHPDTLSILNNLAALLRAQGRYDEAEPLLREALRLRRDALGPNHPDTLRSMNGLASLLLAQSRPSEAEPLLREALRASLEVLGPNHPITMASLNNLATSLRDQGRPNEAEPLIREVLRHPAGGGSHSQKGTETVDIVLKKLSAGVVAFNIPDHMRLARTQTLAARLGINIPSEQLIQDVANGDKVKVAKLKVSSRMQASLLGNSAFDISPSGPQVQFVSSEEANTWYWQITPKLEGEQTLILRLDAFIEVDGKEGTHTVNTFYQTIKVEVGWPETPQEWADWFKKWMEYGGWLWTTLLLPVGLLMFHKWNKFCTRSVATSPPTSKRSE